MNWRNSEGFEIAYKALAITEGAVAGHAGMDHGMLGIRQIWCETWLCFAHLPAVISGASILSGLSVDISKMEIIIPTTTHSPLLQILTRKKNDKLYSK